MESTTINNTVYTPTRLLSFGEVRKIRSSMGEFMAFTEKIKNKKQSEMNAADFEKMEELMAKNQDSDQYLVDAIAECYNMTQEDIDKLDYQDAVSLFSNLFNESTVIKKKQGQQYA